MEQINPELFSKRDYPRSIPLRGKDHNSGEPKDFTQANTPEDHRKLNPADFDRFVEEKTMTPEMRDGDALQRAVEAERERCAGIAETMFGKNGKRIAAAIRGEVYTDSKADEKPELVGVGAGAENVL